MPIQPKTSEILPKFCFKKLSAALFPTRHEAGDARVGSELRPLESLASEFCFLPSSDFARFPTLVVRIQGLCLLRLLQGQKAQFLIETAEFDAFRELLFIVLPFPVY